MKCRIRENKNHTFGMNALLVIETPYTQITQRRISLTTPGWERPDWPVVDYECTLEEMFDGGEIDGQIMFSVYVNCLPEADHPTAYGFLFAQWDGVKRWHEKELPNLLRRAKENYESMY